ncbi:hypothetical protein [Paraburkholderia elongata]|uniref:Uncharacterized protein n=1 Tax=Paraburkholderia elongata TaxID=2675747 RepID=A0A972NMB3_9BURK|nr:hypothetical protein [Paraburkholderia elongata]NPT54908.1 hypothetical protein [Paraburkholderia elongata]NPT60937.1 hypothetical protein [Paraburkholderia elongata]
MLYQELIKEFQVSEDVFVGIDKVVLSPKCADCKQGFAMMLGVRDSLKAIEGPDLRIKHHQKSSGAIWVARLRNADKKRILTLVVGVYGGHPYVHLVFNPSKLNADDWFWVELCVFSCFDQSLNWLFQNAIVKKIELYIDLIGVDIHGVIPVTSRKIFRKNYAGKTSVTIYLGTRTNRFSLAVYDKRQHLLDTTKTTIPHALTRVEARLILESMTLRDLAEGKLKDPLTGSVFILSPKALEDFCLVYKGKGLYEQIEQEGTLAGFNLPARKHMVEALPSRCISQWKSHDAWPILLKMFRHFFPDLGGLPYNF